MEEGIPTHGTDLSVFQDCDVVAIATPTASHLNYLEALQDKIILCEKPLGLTPDNQARFWLSMPNAVMSVSISFS